MRCVQRRVEALDLSLLEWLAQRKISNQKKMKQSSFPCRSRVM